MADAIASFAPIQAVTPLVPSAGFDVAAGSIAGSTTVPETGGSGFAQVLDQIGAVEESANVAAVDLAAGRLTNPHEFTALASQARLTVELSAAVRNRAVEAFNEVMRMQV